MSWKERAAERSRRLSQMSVMDRDIFVKVKKRFLHDLSTLQDTKIVGVESLRMAWVSS